MFDISWGEIAVISAVGLALLGRKDLPPASHSFGYQVGRIVGLLRGARIRADRYATDHQLRQLQNEFKSGLRELDAVKAELAGSMMMGSAGAGGAMMGGGGGLGASVSGIDRIRSSRGAAAIGGGGGGWEVATPMIDGTSSKLPPANAPRDGDGTTFPQLKLAPRSRSVAAVAEEEWEKRGIGFRSIAEGGGGDNNKANNDGGLHHHPKNSISTINGGGRAVILSNYLRQSLIYDQYDRTLRLQDEALRTRVEKVRNERNILDAIANESSSSKK